MFGLFGGWSLHPTECLQHFFCSVLPQADQNSTILRYVDGSQTSMYHPSVCSHWTFTLTFAQNHITARIFILYDLYYVFRNAMTIISNNSRKFIKTLLHKLIQHIIDLFNILKILLVKICENIFVSGKVIQNE